MDYTKIEEYKQWLKENLNSERYEHSLGVAECAKELAEQFGVNPEKAYLAGLIHDCAKCLPENDLKTLLCSCEDVCEEELVNTKTFHAPCGVIVAKNKFGINDEEILSAIRCHTVGKTDMTDFEKVIFIADKIETRTRPEDWTTPVRNALKQPNGLDSALLVCYSNTIKSLVDRKLMICTVTIEIYNNLLKKLCK